MYQQPSLGPVDDSFRKIVIAGSTVQAVVNPSPDGSLGDRSSTETWSAVGTNMTIQQSCPKTPASQSVPFTVEKQDGGATRLIIYASAGGASGALVYAKQ